MNVQTEWTWRRLATSNAYRIVALGTIAEHGLLRLFARRGFVIAERGRSVEIKPHSDDAWTKHYAVVGRTLGYWLEQQAWWTVTGKLDGHLRKWTLLPVFHPAWSQGDSDYKRTVELLARLLDGKTD